MCVFFIPILQFTLFSDILNITPTPIAKQPAAVPVNVAPANVAPAAPRPPVGNTPRGSGVEESQLAARFRRKPIDPMELEFIGVSVK